MPVGKVIKTAGKVVGLSAAPITLGMTGGSLGVAYGAQTNTDPVFSGAIGTVAGVGAGIAIDAIASNPKKFLSAVGTPGYLLGKSIVNHTLDGSLLAGGKAILNGAATVGGTTAAIAAKGLQIGGLAATEFAGEIGSIGKGLLKPTESNMLGVKLNPLGAATIGVGVLAAGAKKAFQEHEKRHMGTNDGRIVTATPGTTSSTMNYAGATGDLNFSMYTNRRG